MSPRIEVGQTFSGYRIEAVVGRGGMGVVYRAEQPELGRQVALKVIAPEHAANPVFRERFRRESRLAASIEHPNAIPIYEAGVADDETMFLVMRYVDGVDLSSVINRDGPLDPSRAARIVEQVAGALDEAHARGLVHRDVKPGNILIASRRGREHALLTDFGLTKLAASQSGVTATGNWVGTIDYASPEQIRGRRLDARSDVYALGCVMFCALTGRVPFERETDVAKLYAHANDEPPLPSSLRPGVPPELDEVVMRALAKEPEDRYPSAGDFGRATLAGMTGIAVAEPERTVATGEAAPGSDEIAVPPAGGVPGPTAAAPPPTEPVTPPTPTPGATAPVGPPAPPPTAPVPPRPATPAAQHPPEAVPPAPTPPEGATAQIPVAKKRRLGPLLAIAGIAVVLIGGAFATGLIGGSSDPGGEQGSQDGGEGGEGGGGALQFERTSFDGFSAEVPSGSSAPETSTQGTNLITGVDALDGTVQVGFVRETAGAPADRAAVAFEERTKDAGFEPVQAPEDVDIGGQTGAQIQFRLDEKKLGPGAFVVTYFLPVSDAEGFTYRIRTAGAADGPSTGDVEKIARTAAESFRLE